MDAKDTKAGETILLVEDEEDIMELLRYNLEREGYRILEAPSGEMALGILKARVPDLVLLDLMLPGIDGLTVCRTIRANPATARLPVIMLTAKGEEADIVTGLELGADDYVTKPFSPRVLLARVRAVFRRHAPPPPPIGEGEVIVRGEIEIHPERREVLIAGEPVQLTFTEFNVLLFLARRPGWVFTRSQIVAAARGEDYHVTERAVDVQIVGLRRKLGPAGRLIEAVRGVGYRFRG